MKAQKIQPNGQVSRSILSKYLNTPAVNNPGNYVAAVGSLDNAINVLEMIKETKIDGKAILYPHIKQTPLQRVDYWDKKKEIVFLNHNLL